MSETYASTPEARPNGSAMPGASMKGATGDAGKALLVGLIGGVISAAGYLVYQRLPDDQKARLHQQVRGLLEERLSEIRQNFNI